MTTKKEVDEKFILTDDSGLVMKKGTGGVTRVYVPRGRREALFKMYHEGIYHLSANKTYASMHRHFDWPTIRRDSRHLYSKCAFCELSKATRNLTHKRSRAIESRTPRSRYGMDYYSVGNGEVLGIIDLTPCT